MLIFAVEIFSYSVEIMLIYSVMQLCMSCLYVDGIVRAWSSLPSTVEIKNTRSFTFGSCTWHHFIPCQIITRLRDSARVLHWKTGQTKANRKQLETDSDKSHLLRTYNTFLLWLLEFSFNNLFPGANFGRRVSSLQVLFILYI